MEPWAQPWRNAILGRSPGPGVDPERSATGPRAVQEPDGRSRLQVDCSPSSESPEEVVKRQTP